MGKLKITGIEKNGDILYNQQEKFRKQDSHRFVRRMEDLYEKSM